MKRFRGERNLLRQSLGYPDAASMDPQFVDLIYESAFAPDLWPRVLDGLAQTIDARAAACCYST